MVFTKSILSFDIQELPGDIEALSITDLDSLGSDNNELNIKQEQLLTALNHLGVRKSLIWLELICPDTIISDGYLSKLHDAIIAIKNGKMMLSVRSGAKHARFFFFDRRQFIELSDFSMDATKFGLSVKPYDSDTKKLIVTEKITSDLAKIINLYIHRDSSLRSIEIIGQQLKHEFGMIFKNVNRQIRFEEINFTNNFIVTSDPIKFAFVWQGLSVNSLNLSFNELNGKFINKVLLTFLAISTIRNEKERWRSFELMSAEDFYSRHFNYFISELLANCDTSYESAARDFTNYHRFDQKQLDLLGAIIIFLINTTPEECPTEFIKMGLKTLLSVNSNDRNMNLKFNNMLASYAVFSDVKQVRTLGRLMTEKLFQNATDLEIWNMNCCEHWKHAITVLLENAEMSRALILEKLKPVAASSIKKLNISGSNFDLAGACSLSSFLQNLSFDDLNISGAITLQSYNDGQTKYGVVLEKLFTSIKRTGVMHLTAQSFPGLGMISHNFAHIFSHMRLKSLDISHTILSDVDFTNILNILDVCNGIEQLVFNDISAEGPLLNYILEKIITLVGPSKLKYLSLNGNKISAVNAVQIDQLQAYLANIRTIHMINLEYPLSENSVQNLIDIATYTRTTDFFIDSFHYLSPEGQESFIRYLANPHNTMTVRLKDAMYYTCSIEKLRELGINGLHLTFTSRGNTIVRFPEANALQNRLASVLNRSILVKELCLFFLSRFLGRKGGVGYVVFYKVAEYFIGHIDYLSYPHSRNIKPTQLIQAMFVHLNRETAVDSRIYTYLRWRLNQSEPKVSGNLFDLLMDAKDWVPTKTREETSLATAAAPALGAAAAMSSANVRSPAAQSFFSVQVVSASAKIKNIVTILTKIDFDAAVLTLIHKFPNLLLTKLSGRLIGSVSSEHLSLTQALINDLYGLNLKGCTGQALLNTIANLRALPESECKILKEAITEMQRQGYSEPLKSDVKRICTTQLGTFSH